MNEIINSLHPCFVNSKRVWKSSINLRLLTDKPYVWHIGNWILSINSIAIRVSHRKALIEKALYLPGIRYVLLWVINKIFLLYLFNVD